LTEFFRQAAESRIIVNAHRINHGLMPDLAQAVTLGASS
jgi:exodeoxyribonuclease V alpha subunit